MLIKYIFTYHFNYFKSFIVLNVFMIAEDNTILSLSSTTKTKKLNKEKNYLIFLHQTLRKPPLLPPIFQVKSSRAWSLCCPTATILHAAEKFDHYIITRPSLHQSSSSPLHFHFR